MKTKYLEINYKINKYYITIFQVLKYKINHKKYLKKEKKLKENKLLK